MFDPNYVQHIISSSSTARTALQLLDTLPDSESRTLFVVSDQNKLVGTLTDGDIRRGLLKDREIMDNISLYMNTKFRYLKEHAIDPTIIAKLRALDIWLIPVVDDNFNILRIIDLKTTKTVLPAVALIMAGGKGERLRPLTEITPKPLLSVGDKPIIEHNIDRLIKFGIKQFYISVCYLKEKIIDHLGDGSSKGISIKYIHEDKPLGTIGSMGSILPLTEEHVLVMNSDILTNLDYEDFFNYYLQKNVLMCMASIPYNVSIPYGVLEAGENHNILSLKEKPTYTYYSNAGIYLIRAQVQKYVKSNVFLNATDLMERLIADNINVVHYPVLNYWLDIGRHEDFIKAQQDIKLINL